MAEAIEFPEILDRLVKLPHWDRVAISAFCARLVGPFYGTGLQNLVDEKRNVSLWKGITAIERSAEKGKPIVDPGKLRIEFTIARGSVRRAVDGRDDPSEPTEQETLDLSVSELVVTVCEQAVETMESSERESFTPAYWAYVWTEKLLDTFRLQRLVDLVPEALDCLEAKPFKKRRIGRSGATLKRTRDRIGELLDSIETWGNDNFE